MNNEEKIFMRWVISYQTTMKYEDFKRELNITENTYEDNKTEEDILDSVRQILEGTNGTKHI